MHQPIMCEEIDLLIKKVQPKSIIDCTFGSGGHTKIFLENNCEVFAFDQDPDVKKYADSISNNKFHFFLDNFSEIDKHINGCDFLFADLGMSTMQLNSDRGFSFMSDSELDMRMGAHGLKLKHVLNKMPRHRMAEIIRDFGEEKKYNKIATNIVNYRLQKDIDTTLKLREAIGFDDYKILARVFQAFRIFINEEIQALEVLLEKIPKIIKFGCMFLTFHSLEDRRIKHFVNKYNNHGLLYPSDQEIQINSKSRSAKLRFGFTMD